MVTQFAPAIIRHLAFFSLPAGHAIIQAQSVAMMPVGIPRRVVLSVEYPKPETMMAEKVMIPPLGMF